MSFTFGHSMLFRDFQFSKSNIITTVGISVNMRILGLNFFTLRYFSCRFAFAYVICNNTFLESRISSPYDCSFLFFLTYVYISSNSIISVFFEQLGSNLFNSLSNFSLAFLTQFVTVVLLHP